MGKKFKTIFVAKMYMRYRKVLLWFKSLFVDVSFSHIYIEHRIRVRLRNGSHTEFWVNETFVTKAQEADMARLISEYIDEEIGKISGSTSV